MHHFYRLVAVFGLVTLVSSAAQAISPLPAPPEEMLCTSDYIFLGRIMSVVNEKSDGVRVGIVVTRILGVRPEVAKNPELGLRVGQTIRPRAGVPPDATDKYRPDGGLAFDEWKAAYVGREVLLSGGAGFVVVWPPDREAAWARDAMGQRVGRLGARPGADSCPSPL
jgi:hypothetical protein